MSCLPACLRALGLLLALALGPPALAQAPQRGFAITHYDLQLEPDFQARSIRGQLRLRLVAMRADLRHVALDAGALQIDAVREAGRALAADRQGTALIIRLATPAASGAERELLIDYHGTPTQGLSFHAEVQQVATAFATSQWMPSLDDPDARATFELRLLLPPGLLAVGNGEAGVPEAQSDGRVLWRWRLAQPMPGYLYGFAAGPFREVRASAGTVALRFLGPQSFSAAELAQVFSDSADMLAFYQERAGVPYPLNGYTQVLLHGPGAQEMAGFSVMGERYGRRVLHEPGAIWLGAHEAAHQWWGNGVTNRAWTHFWLNEGIATFMTAAYLEHRFGPEEYSRQIDAAAKKYEALRTQGLDKPLVFPDWKQPSAADRSLVYDKGAYVVHLLRQHIGEQRFWAGLRAYTRKHWGQSVVTADFQAAMEGAFGASLQGFFDRWVYLRLPDATK